ncbi:MAG: metallophosphoesterase [Planctomycetota bacterium]|jgi:hypothetical protein|nr:metallophosphoesterase [Planctomycetota bacterium]
MLKFKVIAFGVALVGVIFAFDVDQRVRSPRFGNPAMLLQDENFEVVVDGYSSIFSPDVEFELIAESGNPYSLKIETRKGKNFLVSIKDDIPAGAFTLRATIGEHTLENPKAVFVYENFPSSYKIAHAADLPDLDKGESEKLLHALFADVVESGAEIFLLTGDIVYHGGRGRYRRFYEAAIKFDIPVIICPGNHEREDWPSYVYYYPDPVHVTQFGELKIISLDSAHGREQISDAQLRWFKEKLNQNSATETIVQIHHPVVGPRSIERNQQEFIELLLEHNVAATLSGHTHVDALHLIDGSEWVKEQMPPRPWLITTTTYDYDHAPAPNGGLSIPGYRLLTITDNKLSSIGSLQPNGRSFMSEHVNLDSKLNK